jgi:hypothetical protein
MHSPYKYKIPIGYLVKGGHMPNLNTISSSVRRLLAQIKTPLIYFSDFLLFTNSVNNGQNNAFIDSSTNNFTITRNGNVSKNSVSPFNTSSRCLYNKNLSGGGISVPTNPVLNIGTNNFTIECWINLTALPVSNGWITNAGGNQAICGCGPDNSGTGMSFFFDTTKIYFDLTSNGSGPINIAHGFLANTWYHIALVRNGNNFSLYKNGKLLQTAVNTGSFPTNYPMGIGIAEAITGFSGAWLNGYLSNFRFSNVARYTSEFIPSVTKLASDSNTLFLVCQDYNLLKDNGPNNLQVYSRPGYISTIDTLFASADTYPPVITSESGYFDGSGDYLTVADNTAFSFGSGDFTIEGWVKPILSVGSIDAIISKRATTGNVNYLALSYWNTGGVGLYVSSNGSSWDIFADNGSVKAFNFGAWNHFSFVRKGNIWGFFVNGKRTHLTTKAASLNSPAGVPFTVGAGSANGGQPMNGYLSDIRVINGTAVYDPSLTSLSIPTAPLATIANTALHLKFQNTSVYDKAMNVNIETVGNAKVDTNITKNSPSITFSGSGDYLRINDSYMFNFMGRNFTVEAWVYKKTNTDMIIVSNQTTGTSIPSFKLWTPSSGTVCFSFSANGTTLEFNRELEGGSVLLNTWTHVAVVRNNDAFTLFVNGIPVSTKQNTKLLYNNNNPALIGATGDGSMPFNGYIAELRVMSKYARYNSPFTPPSSPLQVVETILS